MRKLILPLLLALPTLAIADSVREYEWDDHKPTFGWVFPDALWSQPEAVLLRKRVVEVPLYDCGQTHCIKVLMGDEELMLELGLGAGVALKEGVVEKVRRRNLRHAQPYEVATVDLAVGDAGFGGLKVLAGVKGAGGHDGQFGLGTFPNLSVAVLPSQGVLKLAPAGTDLLSEVDGARLSYHSDPHRVVKDGGKHLLYPHPIVLEGTLDGQSVAVLPIAGTSLIAEDALGDRSPGWENGSARLYGLDLVLGTQTVSTFAIATPPTTATHDLFQVALGTDVTAWWDYAYDPTSMTFVFAEISESARRSVEAEALEEALAGLSPEAVEGEEPPPPLEGEELAAALADVTDAYRELGLTPGYPEKALEHAIPAAEADPESCALQFEVGIALVELGRYPEARGPLMRSTELYQPWAELPLEERSALEDSRDEDPELYEGPRPQSHDCNDAWSALAMLDLIDGNYEGAAALYEEHFDLNAELAMYAGAAYLELGRVADAEAAWRQFMVLESVNPMGFAALGLFNEHKGHTPEAAEAYTRANDPIGLARVAPESTHFEDLALTAGDDSLAWLDYAIFLHQSGQDPTEAAQKAVRAVERHALIHDDSLTHGFHAVALVLAGETEQGSERALELLEQKPGDFMGHLALAWATEGSESAEHLRMAAAVSGYASLWALL